jgi:hypothetical protein
MGCELASGCTSAVFPRNDARPASINQTFWVKAKPVLDPESEARGKPGGDQQQEGHENIFEGAARKLVRNPDA